MKTVSLHVIMLLQTLWGTVHAQNEYQTIQVNVTNIKANKGTILVGLYKNEKDFLNKTYKGTKIKANKEGVQVTFKNIEPGTYAISLYHDKDDNNEMNTFLGIPTEPYGVSNNAKGQFGPPQWEEAKFKVSGQKTIQNISL